MEATFDNLEAKAAPDTAAHLLLALEKCPTCDAHVVRINLVSYQADKQVVNNTINTLEKVEPAQHVQEGSHGV